MRKIADGLDRLFEQGQAHFAQQKGEHNGERKAENEAVEAQQKGIADDPPEKRAAEEIDEMLEPMHGRPGAAENPLAGGVAFERDERSSQRDVRKGDIKLRDRGARPCCSSPRAP